MPNSASQRWLAYELHDGLLQWVIGARLQLIAVRSREDQAPETYRRAIGRAVASLENALVEARELIGYLERQPDNGQTRIGLALIQFIDSVAREAELHEQRIVPQLDSTDLESLETELSDGASWNLLRIAQQAIRNAINHAGPTNIQVQLQYQPSPAQLVLTVSDGGRGFDRQLVAAKPTGFGLSSMAHRAQLIGAELEIDSSPGNGCRVSCRLPLPSSA